MTQITLSSFKISSPNAVYRILNSENEITNKNIICKKHSMKLNKNIYAIPFLQNIQYKFMEGCFYPHLFRIQSRTLPTFIRESISGCFLKSTYISDNLEPGRQS